MNLKILLVWMLLLFTTLEMASAQQSVAREWNEVLLEAIRNDFARPTVHARNLWHTSVLMYDLWAVYDDTAQTFFLGRTVDGFTCQFNGISTPPDVEAAREEAISYGMYRLLRHRFLSSPGASVTYTATDNLMAQLGFDTNVTTTDYSGGSAAALGNYIAQEMISFGLQDNSNEQNQYANVFYQPVNPSMIMDLSGNPDILDLNRWQPLTLDVFIDQAGNVIPINTPDFLSPEWGTVTPFSLKPEDLTIYQRNGDDYWVYCDPGMPPQIDTIAGLGTSDYYKWGFSLVSSWSSHLDPTDGVMWDISPASIGNIDPANFPETLTEYQNFYDIIDGGDASLGHAINPVTGSPYTPQIVPRADYARVLAEFWADGPDSETPPGHWFTLLNYVNDHPLFEKKFRGQGPVIDDLEWDVKAYFIMGGGMHDVAVAVWGCKGWYDYIRPVSAIRAMAERGQCTDTNDPTYHPAGIPLIEGKIAIVQPGEMLAEPNDENAGKIKLLAWRGPEYINDPDLDEAGVDWILAENWWPYQRPSFVTPPFAGYVSGHSTFSRAAAEIMTMLTGDAYFPGGMGEFQANLDQFLVFEDGPSANVILQWATYRDASDQCSLSRIWGGIHPPADDIPGRIMGIKIGVDVFNHSESYFFKDEDQDGWYDYQDCDDLDASINPGATESCNGIDNNCNGISDDGVPTTTYYMDADNDGYGDPAISIDTCIMVPPTGFVWLGTDCDDNNNMINPGVSEFCDGIDNNCNGMTDEGLFINTYFRDNDNDGYGDAAFPLDTCALVPPAGYGFNDLDCDDDNNMINPGLSEVCDGLDNDCSGVADDNLPTNIFYLDNDGDGFGDAFMTIDTCSVFPPEGYVLNFEDCNDENGEINPDAVEVIDGEDNDCNGLTDDVVGVEELNYHTRIYPNPVSDVLLIEMEYAQPVNASVYTPDGRLMMEQIMNFGGASDELDFSTFPQGLYFLFLSNAEGEKLVQHKILKL